MSEMTVYACNIESVDSMGFPLQAERTVYLASDVDALLAMQREKIKRLKELLQRRSRIGDEDRALAVRLQAELEGVRLEHSALTAKVQGWRVCIAELCGHPLSDPLINVIDPIALVTTLTQQLAAREGQVSELEKALKIAVCPYCNDIGWTVHPDRNTGEACQVQCEWCYNKQALTKPSA